MPKLNKVLAVYDRNGNRQAIPLYSSLSDVNNLGRHIKVAGIGDAYYPLTENLSHANASKKTVVIGSKTYKALLTLDEVPSRGIRTILDALDSNGYISPENSKKIENIDRSVGGVVKINHNDNMDDYNFADMFSNGTVVKLDDYSDKSKKIDYLSLIKFSDSDIEMTYEVPVSALLYSPSSLDYTSKLTILMADSYNYAIDSLFNGPIVLNMHGDIQFLGKYTDAMIKRMLINSANSHLTTNEIITGHSSHINKIKLGTDTIDPLASGSYNTIEISGCDINELSNWNFTTLVYQNPSDATCNTFIAPVTNYNENNIDYLFRTGRDTVRDKSVLTGNSNRFDKFYVVMNPTSKKNASSDPVLLTYQFNIIAHDTTGAKIELAKFYIIAPVIKNISSTDYATAVASEKTTITDGDIIAVDYNKFKAGVVPSVKVIFGNDILHTLLITPEVDENTYNLYYNIRTIKSDILVDGKAKSRTLICNLKTGQFGNISKYPGTDKPSLNFTVNNMLNIKQNSKFTDQYPYNFMILSTDPSIKDTLLDNTDLFLFNVFNIMNEPGYNQSSNCVYYQNYISESDAGDFMSILMRSKDENRYTPLSLTEMI